MIATATSNVAKKDTFSGGQRRSIVLPSVMGLSFSTSTAALCRVAGRLLPDASLQFIQFAAQLDDLVVHFGQLHLGFQEDLAQVGHHLLRELMRLHSANLVDFRK